MSNDSMINDRVITRDLTSAEQIKMEFPLSNKAREVVRRSREEATSIIAGLETNKKILLHGPCSAWPPKAVIEYAEKINELLEPFKDKVLPILRVYTQKPRTSVGWGGPIKQPDISNGVDIDKGIRVCREMCIDALEIGTAIADEALFTHNESYFDDLYSWLAIGARSTEDAEHRFMASCLDIPVGMKNPTSGEIVKGIHSVIAAKSPQINAQMGKQATSFGNMFAHLVLRGGNYSGTLSEELLGTELYSRLPEELRDESFTSGPNHRNLERTIQLIKENRILRPAIIVDCSHDNTIVNGKKDYRRQPMVANEVFSQMRDSSEVYRGVAGVMVESFLVEGKQSDETPLSEMVYGQSITDGCISIEKVIEIAGELHNVVSSR